MFTGIVEEIGVIKSIVKSKEKAKLTIECTRVLENTIIGDSIATNGVCLTVIDLGKNTFTADIMNETLIKSNLGNLSSGSKVNLERACKINSRLGGGIVTGHIDGIGKIIDLKKVSNSTIYTISTLTEICKVMVDKGSVTVDGANLTIVKVYKDSFTISVIPHTSEKTIISGKKIGDTVNVENDVIGKYIYKFCGVSNKEGITTSFLRENGF